MKKIVLAYSGGLDTSYCALYLSQTENHEVHAVTVNTGGLTKSKIEELSALALCSGVKRYECINALDAYYTNIIRYLIYGNIKKNKHYPLSVSAERIIQVMELIRYARKVGATHIAHGCTGAGNDQVRFDLLIQILAPELHILSPIRDQQVSRKASIAYLKSHGVDRDWKKAAYSINKGLWGTTIGGVETLSPDLPLPEHAYPSQLVNETPTSIRLGFTEGEITSLNGTIAPAVDLIEQLQDMASAYAIGRGLHVGDTIVGIKGRVGFEAAAPELILSSHYALERHVLTKWQLHYKENIAHTYGMLLHEGQYLDPVMRDLEAYLKSSQVRVTGEVTVKLYPYRYEIQGIKSPYDLLSQGASHYGEETEAWTASEAKGFIKILSNSIKTYHQINQPL